MGGLCAFGVMDQLLRTGAGLRAAGSGGSWRSPVHDGDATSHVTRPGSAPASSTQLSVGVRSLGAVFGAANGSSPGPGTQRPPALEKPGRGRVSRSSGSGPSRVAGLEPGERRHVRVVQREVEQRDVLPDPRRGDRLRDHHVAQLQVPAQHDLRRRAAVPSRPARATTGSLQRLALAERAPRLGGDAVLGVEARSGSCWSCGCSSIWLTAGTT